jgi:poly(A) polymerase
MLCKNLAKAGQTITTPTIIPRAEHVISRAQISDYALKVLYRLNQAGYEAYLVGGGVRDLLLGREPKDFDVATNATPEQVKEQFRNCRLIGRRFRLAHVHFGQVIIEVATFRAPHDSVDVGDEDGEEDSNDRRIENGRIVRDNVYGSLEEDAWRRDFTINALYYNVADFSVVDYVGGMDDLKRGQLRLIGDPEQRYREDAVRMLRAVRFAAKLGFDIHAASEQPIFKLGGLLREIPPSRLFEEVLKLFMSGQAVQVFELLRHYHLFDHLFPQTEASLSREEQGFPIMLVVKALANTDARIAAGKPVTPAFLFAALLWEPARLLAEQKRAAGMDDIEALAEAGDEVVGKQVKSITIPKRFTLPMREIWNMQPRFENRSGKRPQRLLGHPRFRAAYDFLLLRAESGEADMELAQWWTDFQRLDHDPQDVVHTPEEPSKRPRRRRRRSRSDAPAGNTPE